MWGKFLSSDNASGKIQIAREFSERLWNRHIEFIGISGSVSYTPEPGDDIDIFLITKNGWLWPELFWAFLLRRILRMNEICLSLSLDSSSAGLLFQRLTHLHERDAMHVIPMKGKDFYCELLRQRQVVDAQGDVPALSNSTTKLAPKTFMGLINIVFFLLMSPLQKLKEIRFNSLYFRTEPEVIYHIRMGPGTLILDSEKYRKLSGYVEETND